MGFDLNADPPHLPCCGEENTLTVQIEPVGAVRLHQIDGQLIDMSLVIDSARIQAALRGRIDGCPLVVLTATTASGLCYDFTGWSGGDVHCPGTGDCTAYPTLPLVTATFDISTYTLTVIVHGDVSKNKAWIFGVRVPKVMIQSHIV